MKTTFAPLFLLSLPPPSFSPPPFLFDSITSMYFISFCIPGEQTLSLAYIGKHST